jgi:hypothetical protein
MSSQEPDDSGWKWRYSMFGGIMYGPIPVGIIILLIAAIIYFVYFNR